MTTSVSARAHRLAVFSERARPASGARGAAAPWRAPAARSPGLGCTRRGRLPGAPRQHALARRGARPARELASPARQRLAQRGRWRCSALARRGGWPGAAAARPARCSPGAGARQPGAAARPAREHTARRGGSSRTPCGTPCGWPAAAGDGSGCKP
jgi:hypothetical protein